MKSFFGALLVCAFIATVFGGGDPYAYCDLPSNAGSLCAKSAPTTRYYYNGVSGSCEEFEYRGCGGNDNNFETPWDCDTTCISLGSSRP
ncbi:unnamed protein product [Diamesa serratosioi]